MNLTLLAIFYIPVIIFSITAFGEMGRVKVLKSNLLLLTAILMGVSIITLFTTWVIYQQWAPALISIASWTLVVWLYFLTKGKENQILLAVNEEVQSGNYNISAHDLQHISYEEYIPETIEILKSKGMISYKVVYSGEENNEVSFDENYEQQEDTEDAILNFERRHNLRR